MMAGMDDKEDNEDMITLEAMSGLSKILTQVSDKDIQAILINVALRIRPCFEKVSYLVTTFFYTLFYSCSWIILIRQDSCMNDAVLAQVYQLYLVTNTQEIVIFTKFSVSSGCMQKYKLSYSLLIMWLMALLEWTLILSK